MNHNNSVFHIYFHENDEHENENDIHFTCVHAH